jgi:hypothetical protein
MKIQVLSFRQIKKYYFERNKWWKIIISARVEKSQFVRLRLHFSMVYVLNSFEWKNQLIIERILGPSLLFHNFIRKTGGVWREWMNIFIIPFPVASSGNGWENDYPPASIGSEVRKLLASELSQNVRILFLLWFHYSTGVQNRSRPIKLTRRFHRGKKTT